ncbi:SDR family oxidoreductase [Puia sp.]|jgi:uncharacterized protein YbjT (DUF2867 family)|uniref:SDR family oxidoreductase n=1 Tax=Puia sp. TaxID=2045100 RepID=UPI002F423AF9
MKIVIIGGSGLIGSKATARLRGKGNEIIAASPNTGVNTLTGEGLDEVLDDAETVIDLTNAPSWEDNTAMEFFTTSGRILLAAEKRAGVRHHLVLSVVGIPLMQESGYMRAKKAQEDLIAQSGIPHTIIRSTQFFEFIKGITDHATEGNIVRLSDVQFQPIAAQDVAVFVAESALEFPVNSLLEIAGPDRFPLPGVVTRYLQRTNDPRRVEPNDRSRYYGARIEEFTLVPAGLAKLGTINLDAWLAGQPMRA